MVIDEEIPKITIPEITLPFWTAIGNGTVTTDLLTIEKFNTPKIDFNLSSEGISWWTSSGAVKLKGLWSAKFTELITVSDNGWLNAIATDIRMKISAQVYQLDGQPQIRIGDCVVEIVHLDIEIGGSVLSWLVNLFRSQLSSLLENVIHSETCVAAKGILLDQANQFLHSLPSHIDIGKHFFVDYFLLQNPKSTRDYTEFELAADVVYGKRSCHPIKDSNWTDAGPSPSMITTWISEAIPNCLLQSVHKNELLSYVVSKNIPSVAEYLRTTCSFIQICIGRFFSKLRTKYPKQYIDIVFHTYSNPYFEMSESEGATLNMSLAADLYLNPYQKTKKNVLARLIIDTFTEVRPFLNKSRIFGDIHNFTMNAREDFSYIGDVSELFLRTFSSILSITSQQAIKTVLNVGIPIPKFDNLSIADTSTIDIFDKFARVNIDFEAV